MRHLLLTTTLALSGAAHAAGPAVLAPSSYDMLNGYGTATLGSYNYWDKGYTGSGDTSVDYAPLSGGLGDLTDGVIATERWDVVENLEGTGPYVGWAAIDPVITFHFDAAYTFTQVTVWHDDANGYGNVATPNGFVVTVGGLSQTFAITDPDTDTPFASTLVLDPGFVGSTLQLQVLRTDTATMLSEVQIMGAVPEPGTWGLMAAGLAAVGGLARRRALRPA